MERDDPPGPTTAPLASRRTLAVVAAVAGTALLAPSPAAFAARTSTSTPGRTAAASPAVTATPAAVRAQAPEARARSVLAGMSLRQRVGQLFMVGGPVTGPGAATRRAVTRDHVGNVVLTGRTTSGAAPVRGVTASMDALTTSSATAGVPLLIATDQEGGYVQVLQGPGFRRMPTALTQGGWNDLSLARHARYWGRTVRWSGVDLNLAPVMGTVAKGFASQNAPIGRYEREYGFTPSVVARKATTVLRGFRSQDLGTTAKHFPGLGRVRANTDTTRGVTDTVTTARSSALDPFRAAVRAGTDTVMMSSAVYSRIDPDLPAVFSSKVVTGLLRQDLGFDGVVVSDDVGSAAQVQPWSPSARALMFLRAGGDIVLTVDPALVHTMVETVTSRAARHPAMRRTVDAAALRVLTLKASTGMLASRLSTDGALGSRTVTALQRWLRVPRTGRLDRRTTLALQRRVGTAADGAWGPASMAALQDYLGAARDGARTWNARMLVLLQRYLNTQL